MANKRWCDDWAGSCVIVTGLNSSNLCIADLYVSMWRCNSVFKPTCREINAFVWSAVRPWTPNPWTAWSKDFLLVFNVSRKLGCHVPSAWINFEHLWRKPDSWAFPKCFTRFHAISSVGTSGFGVVASVFNLKFVLK